MHEIVGRDGSPGGFIDEPHEVGRRHPPAAPDARNRRAINLSADFLGEGLICNAGAGHPIAEPHWHNVPLWHGTCKAPFVTPWATTGFSPRATLARMRKTYLRAWREFRGLTLEQVAAEIGQTHGILSKIERNKRRYNQTVLEKLSDLYGAEPADLLSKDPTTANDPLAKIVADLPPEDRPRAAEMLKLLTSRRQP